MFEHLEGALDDAGFFRPSEKRPHITLAIRAMLQRASLTEHEVRTLRGMIAALERRPTRPRKTAAGVETTERGKA
jgi:tRNA/rRNA methyltransferase